MSCEGCLTTQKGMQTSFEIIKSQAKKYAKENKTTVAIYKEANEWFYTNAISAIQEGFPIVEIVSQY